MPTSKGANKSKLSESQIKTVLSAADKARQREDANLQRARLAEHARIQGEGKKLLTSYWKKTGLEIAAFEKLRAKTRTELIRLAKAQKADVIKHSPSAKQRLSYGANNWRKTIESLRGPNATLVSQFVPGFEVIETLSSFGRPMASN